MSFSKALLSSAVGAMVVLATPAIAAQQKTFDAKAFAAAQREGRPILVDVHADWCPTCKAQAPLVERVVQAPQFKDMIVFKLDFDTQEADWRRLGVRRQSTLIAFKGAKESGRSVGDTNAASIAKLLESTLR